MDTNTVIEGTVKFRDGKKWKSRWCVVRKLSPVADCIHLQLYRDCKERYKQGQTKASLSLENFLGIQSGFTLDKESNTVAVICQELIVVLAFDTREHLMQWQVKIAANLGEGDQFLVQISSAPAKAKLSPGPARLLLQEHQFCLTVGVPPRLISFWQIRQLRRFGVVDGKFCFEGGSRCGRGEGLYILVSERPEDLARAFHLAADGRLFTKKRPVARNMSVMDKVRKHHTLRPESQLSDVSSLNSTTIESQAYPGYQGSQTTCGSCSLSQEDLVADTLSTCESHKYDLKPFWHTDVGMERCTSCMSKLGSMSRSSTLTSTPCSSFPAWTMDRPKSCGSQKMSSSVTCSSISLSSHSSRGSSCGNVENSSRQPLVDTCGPVHCASRSVCPFTTADVHHTPPSRPPKPAHLSLLRLQTTPTMEQSPSPSPSTPHKCCCGRSMSPFNSQYGNYDIPKPLGSIKPNVKLDSRESPVKAKLSSPSSPIEYYDTPRKIKEKFLWDYGNYDVPPPAQPVLYSTTNNNDDNSSLRKSLTESNCINTSKEKKSMTLDLGCSAEPMFHINKVKLTGEGRMPVMSPCGKIIENPEPTYEEKLERLLETENCSVHIDYPNSSYVNVETIENDSQVTSLEAENNTLNTGQNYTNIGFVQSVDNYENLKNFFEDPSKHTTSPGDTNSKCSDMITTTNENKNLASLRSNLHTKCTNCGHTCSIAHEIPTKISEPLNENNVNHNQIGPKNETSSTPNPTCILFRKSIDNINSFDKSYTFLDVKCSSTSCLNEMRHDYFCSLEKSEENKKNIESKTLPKYSSSAVNSPDLKRLMRLYAGDQIINSKLQRLSIRNRSNSADSARIHMYDKSVTDTVSTSSNEKALNLSQPSSPDSLCIEEKLNDGSKTVEKTDNYINTCDLKITPLRVQEVEDSQETFLSKFKLAVKYPDSVNARRSSSVPNKFFSNRDSSSSNDSGVSTGSFTLKQFGTDFLDFEMPLTTSMSSRRHHIAMINNASCNNSEANHIIPKRSKSVDPLRDLTFTFDFGEQQIGKSVSAEAKVPLFLQENRNIDYLSPYRTALPDSRSTSSGTSDMSDYFETLSFSSFCSLDTTDKTRTAEASATMKPRSGKEYHKIDRYLLSQETKQ